MYLSKLFVVLLKEELGHTYNIWLLPYIDLME